MRYLCVDFGSTWTKAMVIDSGVGLVGAAARPTTIATDVLDGYAACRRVLADAGIDLADAETIACSSAGGGLRIAVIGNEELVTSEAGRRVALSSGGHVIAVLSGGVRDVAELAAARPDMILLVGGTDGGNSATYLAAAAALGQAGLDVPVVAAGDATVADEVTRLLADVPHRMAPNVVPEIGVFHPGPARAQARELFLSHVIGGKGLSASGDFAAMIVGATPDVVLRGVEVAAREVGDLVVVDVGGATTDVHSVVAVEHPEPRGDEAGEVLSSDVVGQVPATRTVEGDLGMRWSAATTVAAGRREGLLDDDEALDTWVVSLAPDTLPGSADEQALDHQIAHAAIATALRRHAGYSEVMFVNGQRIVQQSGTDIREAHRLLGSGGVLRADADTGSMLLRAALESARTPGRMLPRHVRVGIDAEYLLAAIGLIAEREPATAALLAEQLA